MKPPIELQGRGSRVLIAWKPYMTIPQRNYCIVPLLKPQPMITLSLELPDAGEARATYGLGGESNGTSSSDVAEWVVQPPVVSHGNHAGKPRLSSETFGWAKFPDPLQDTRVAKRRIPTADGRQRCCVLQATIEYVSPQRVTK